MSDDPLLEEKLYALAEWLRNASEEYMKEAMGRRSNAAGMSEATLEELREGKKLAEQMIGRRCPGIKADVKSAKASADIDIRIANKLEVKSHLLSQWADIVTSAAQTQKEIAEHDALLLAEVAEHVPKPNEDEVWSLDWIPPDAVVKCTCGQVFSLDWESEWKQHILSLRPDAAATLARIVKAEHDNHTKFAAELYSILVGPVEEPLNEAEAFAQMKESALKTRQQLFDLPGEMARIRKEAQDAANRDFERNVAELKLQAVREYEKAWVT